MADPNNDSSLLLVVLCASLLVACSASRQNAPGQYAQSRDSATNAAMTNRALSTPQIGEKMPVVPMPGPVRGPVVGALAAAAAGGEAIIDASQSLDSDLLDRIDEALEECADMARAEVMLKHFKNRGPTHKECSEEVGRDSRGAPITRAMQLGVEQHRVALRCVEEKLSKLKPGGFSLSPRYRYDSATGRTEFIPRETVQELLRQGKSAELKGTLEPDIVIHEGAPQQVQAVYDYKFPCVNTDQWSSWRKFPERRADRVVDQGDLYELALKVKPRLVQPHLGVHP
jgi:hypothetical protein